MKSLARIVAVFAIVATLFSSAAPFADAQSASVSPNPGQSSSQSVSSTTLDNVDVATPTPAQVVRVQDGGFDPNVFTIAEAESYCSGSVDKQWKHLVETGQTTENPLGLGFSGPGNGPTPITCHFPNNIKGRGFLCDPGYPPAGSINDSSLCFAEVRKDSPATATSTKTTTSTATATATKTATPTRTPTPTATPIVHCSGNNSVPKVLTKTFFAANQNGPGRNVSISAETTKGDTDSNRLTALTFNVPANGKIEGIVALVGENRTDPNTWTKVAIATPANGQRIVLPDNTNQINLGLRNKQPTQALTVPILIEDDCHGGSKKPFPAWQTFFGGGTDAWHP